MPVGCAFSQVVLFQSCFRQYLHCACVVNSVLEGKKLWKQVPGLCREGGKGWSRYTRSCSLPGQSSPCPVCSPSCQHLQPLIRVAGQCLFLNRMLVVTPRCLLSALGHRCPGPSFMYCIPFPHPLPRWGGLSSGSGSGRLSVSAVHSRVMIV